MTNFDYYEFQATLAIDKIQEEIAFYEASSYANCYPFRDYLLYLRSRIGIDKPKENSMYRYDGTGNKREIKKMNIDEYSKDIDVMMFNRPWKKLKEFHKIMKIKEFIDILTFGKKAKPKKIAENKKYIQDEICNGLKTKKFNKNKSEIVYDQKNMKIISISCLDFNKKNGLYNIDWDS